MMRLNRKRSREKARPAPPDVRLLLRAQSLRGGILAAILTVVFFNLAWVWLATQTARFFPWIGMIQAVFIGLAVQRAGRGLDWRFPAIAAIAAALGSLSGGFFVALSTTELELQASAVRILRGLTVMTWQTYFDEVVTPVDFIYALFAAAVAAFYAKRRLGRHEEYALRTMHQVSEDVDEIVR